MAAGRYAASTGAAQRPGIRFFRACASAKTPNTRRTNLNACGADQRSLTPGSGTAGLAVFTLEQGGAQTSFKVEFLRRNGSGLLYAAQITSDM